MNYIIWLILTLLAALPTIVLFSFKSKISHWFNKDLESHRAELDRKSRQIQASLDTQLETMRIEFGLVQTERLRVLKEACCRLTKILDQINVIASYYEYDCKENVDYKTRCDSYSSDCYNNCIINYWEKVVEFDKYTRETSDFFENNQMFFPIEIELMHLEIISIVFDLRKKAFDINLDLKNIDKEKALQTFLLFHQFDKNIIVKLKNKLVEEYRFIIGVSPTKLCSLEEFRMLQKMKDNSI